MSNKFRCFAVMLLTLSLSAFAGSALAAGHTKLTWYGHAAFKIVTPQGHVLLLDPWITNPANPNGKKELAALDKVDLILVTHGHFDHVGDSVAIAKRTGATLV
ncbi:MAG: MBL fold metallo-hydrolase, partial [Burkholderiales bacterium]